MTLKTIITSTLLMGLIGLVSPAQAEPTENDLIVELLNTTDDVSRGESSQGVMEMHVKTKRYERTMRMEMWAQGEERTLIRILAPAKDAGIATLKVDNNIWNYLPKVDRTMKVPAGMMSGNWMGSHFSNNDLVKDSRLSEDFTATLSEKPIDGAGFYVVSLVPKPDAAIVWGKIVVRIQPDKKPVAITYFDEDGTLMRTMSFEDYREFDGKVAPGTMTLIPANKPGEFTKFTYVSLDFDVEIPDSTFTLQALRP